MGHVLDDARQAGREAAGRHAWREAYELLKSADEEGVLSAEDREALAASAWWTGRLDEAIELRERAFAEYSKGGEPGRAAMVATALWQDYWQKGALSLSNGWLSRAERLLEDKRDSREYGYLAALHAFDEAEAGKYEKALEEAELALDLAKRFADPNIHAAGLLAMGRALVKKGEVDRGLAALDEATAAALSGELDPFFTGLVYCAVINQCQSIGDVRRACEITEAAGRWCDRQDITGFPGQCRIHQAEIMRFRGDWTSAEAAARTACDELQNFNVFVAGAGYYEVGEIRRRLGDFEAAEEAYRKADEFGRDPQPGLALLRLAQGKVDAALAAINRALADDGKEPLARVRRLPAQVEIALAAGDLKTARKAAAELERVAELYQTAEPGTQTLQATLLTVRGALALAEEDAEDAVASLRKARQAWQEIGDPYEVGRTRMLLGLAYRKSGDEDGAVAEFNAARAAFERLGAALDVQRVSELLGDVPVTRTFMFTDIVDSTRLAEALGEAKWKKLLGWHDRTVRELLTARGGEVIKQTGDGFFAAFDSPAAAVEAAIAVQRALEEYDGVAPDVRIGLHAGSAFSKDETDYGGQGVHAAARIGALAGAGEILASRETLTDGAAPYRRSDSREVDLRGISEPVELVSIDWR